MHKTIHGKPRRDRLHIRRLRKVPGRTKIISVKNSDLVNTEAKLLSSDGRVLQKIKLQGIEQNIDIGNLPAVFTI